MYLKSSKRLGPHANLLDPGGDYGVVEFNVGPEATGNNPGVARHPAKKYFYHPIESKSVT